jgi:hypothetical protein
VDKKITVSLNQVLSCSVKAFDSFSTGINRKVGAERSCPVISAGLIKGYGSVSAYSGWFETAQNPPGFFFSGRGHIR